MNLHASQATLWRVPLPRRHPARYTERLLPLFADILRRYGCRSVLDPMAGTGRLAVVRRYGYEGLVICNELEPDWAALGLGVAHGVTVADAARLPFPDRWFDAVCTSPPYGNRLADHHNARDASRRRSYRHDLGRPLHSANTGALQWGDVYRSKHESIWRECARVLRRSGVLVLNVSNHIRNGQVVPVAEWHRDTLQQMGFRILEEHRVETPRMRYGENAERRVGFEFVYVFRWKAA